MMKRRSVRQVELFQGNLVLDVAVPSHIAPKGAAEEMTKMRYTAATCDPEYASVIFLTTAPGLMRILLSDFMRQKYSLRPYLYK